MIYESSPSIEASQGSNYSTKSENAKDLNLDKCQKVFEALGLSPLKKEKVEDSAYVSKKIASATGEMYKNMNTFTYIHKILWINSLRFILNF